MQEPNPIVSPPQSGAPEPQKAARSKVLKYTFAGLGILLGVVLLLAVLIPVLFEDKIKQIFISELNKSLATPVTLNEDDIHLSLFKHFPDASLVFNNVGIRESFPKSQKNFLEAKEISLLFNFWSILRGNYTIEKLVVRDGFCNLVTDKKGNINYRFWKESTDTTASEFSMQLNKVDMLNMDFRYLDYAYNQDVDLHIHDCTFSGNFTSDLYTMQTSGDLLSRRIRIGSSNYLVNKEAHADTKLQVNVPADSYTFEDASIAIEENTFLLNGTIALKGDDHYDLQVTGDRIDLAGLLLLLPGNISGNLDQLDTKGDIDFAAAIKGFYTRTQDPRIDIDFSVRKGSIRHEKFGGRLEDIACVGKYTNGNRQNSSTSSITIKDFSATREGQPVSMELVYNDFANPYINLQLNGTLPASLIIPLGMPDVKEVEGYIAMNNIRIQGALRSFAAAQGEAPPSGTITFDQVAFVLNDERVAIPSGIATVSNNDINLQAITLEAAGSTLFTDLRISNWIQHVFPSDQSPALYLEGSVRADKFDVNGLLALASDNTAAPTSASDGTGDQSAPAPPYDPMNISGRIDLACGALFYDQLKLENVRTSVKLAPGLVVLDGVTGGTMNGTFNMQASFRSLSNGDLLLQTSGQLAGIDVRELFRQLDNFEQDYLTDKNLRGALSANIYDVTVKWDKDYQLDESSIYALCDMRIENGELIDYKALESLSAFVKLSDLKHIKFSTLENKIEIKDRVVILPAMQIRSNALDLYMSGKHTFDNKIDYQFRLSLADLMVRKFLGGNKQKDNYEEDAEGGVNIYVSMTGTVSDPIMAYNKREAKEKLKDSGMEQQRFIDIFKKDPEPTLFQESAEPQTTPTDTEELEFIDFEEDE